MDARLRIGKVYASNEHVRHFEAVKKLVEQNPNLSDDYKRGKLEAIDLYMGMELFNHDVDKMALRKTAEEQARIVRNRLEQRYRKAVEQLLKGLFGDNRRWTWCEGPYTAEGKQCGVFHYRLFCDPAWQPLKPRGEVYTREFTEAGWKSYSELHQL